MAKADRIRANPIKALTIIFLALSIVSELPWLVIHKKPA